MKEQYPCLHKEICLTVKSMNNRIKEAIVRSISSNLTYILQSMVATHKFQNIGFWKHENKTSLLDLWQIKKLWKT